MHVDARGNAQNISALIITDVLSYGYRQDLWFWPDQVEIALQVINQKALPSLSHCDVTTLLEPKLTHSCVSLISDKTVTSDIGVDATFNASSVDYSFTCYKAVTTTDRVLLAYITKSYRSKLVVWMSQRRRSNYKILFWRRKEMLVVWKIYLNNKSQWCKANEVNYIYRYRLMEWLIC